MTNESLTQLLVKALEELWKAEFELLKPTIPHTPTVRLKKYIWISPDVIWPAAKKLAPANYFNIGASTYSYGNIGSRQSSAEALLSLCKSQPAKVMRLHKRITDSINWCYKRADGRARAAQEILKQQARAVEILEEIQAMQSLSNMS